jgi:NAD(P)-dependent dehydrogenase (short-subunit alcohol dehydrogenase family)
MRSGNGLISSSPPAMQSAALVSAKARVVMSDSAPQNAEPIANHERSDVRVSCLCPQGVDTPMLRGAGGGSRPSFLADEAMTAVRVAECVVEGLGREEFLILAGVYRRALDGNAADARAFERGKAFAPVAEMGWALAQRCG